VPCANSETGVPSDYHKTYYFHPNNEEAYKELEKKMMMMW